MTGEARGGEEDRERERDAVRGQGETFGRARGDMERDAEGTSHLGSSETALVLE